MPSELPPTSPPSPLPASPSASSPVASSSPASSLPASSSPAPADSAAPSVQPRVLVVESDIATADLVVALMENIGCAVEVATDGQYGLMLADSFEPHLILLEIGLSGMSGYDVTQILRNDPRYAQRFRSTRIFYLTDKDHMLQKRFDALPGTPMADYIFKPIDVSELLDKVQRAFDSIPDNAP